ncbi:MAG: protein phosphatase 2C domain-containing protein [Candidatus Eremiobacteraeota bacterium]|nr:protein phosphatase 2C domain-containing protein [Candidatus Eremiobacteraeota bacterium]
MKPDSNFEYEIGFSSHTGNVKDLNEDNYCAERREDLDGGWTAMLAVSDGVGGFSLGEIASKIAINHMEKFFKLGEFRQMYDETEIIEPHRVIQELYTRINHIILSMAEKENRQVGCTLASGLFYGNSVYIAGVGNSRAYFIRNGGIKKITEDQSPPLTKVNLDKLTSDETLDTGRKNGYLNSLGSEITLKADIHHINAEDGDIFLFCTDGLYSQVEEMEIVNTVAENPTMQAFCNALIDRANFAGGADNVSVTALRISRKKKTLRSILAGRKKGESFLTQPVLIIATLIGILLLLVVLLMGKKYLFSEKRKKEPHDIVATMPVGQTTSYNSITLQSKIPLNYIYINNDKKSIKEDIVTFEFENDDNTIKIMPDFNKIKKKPKLYTLTMSGLNRNLTVIQARKNKITLNYDTVTVHLTAGSKIDFIAKEERTGEKFILRVNKLGSPFIINMKAEENVQVMILPDKKK